MANVQPLGSPSASRSDLQRRATRYFARLVTLVYDDVAEGNDRNLLNYRFAEDIDVLDAMGDGWPGIP